MSETELLGDDENGIARAVALLRQGACVAFPTETVYGLGADVRSDHAVAGIFEAKGRPSFNPLIVHVAGLDQARNIGVFDDKALRLAKAFWPGPLTLVVPLKQNTPISPLATAGLASVGIRVPDHPVAQRLLRAFDGPLAAPSANPSGLISPTRKEHVVAGLEGKVAGIISSQPSTVGLESTIVRTGAEISLLRAGGVPLEVIEECLGQLVPLAQTSDTPDAPGQLLSHYAPQGIVRLNALTALDGETHLGFGEVEGDLSLSPQGDLREAAARLFACLHELDMMNVTRIAVAPIPRHGLGLAINDRLARAAADRPS